MAGNIGHGITLKFKDGNTIGSLVDVNPPNLTADEIDVTTYASADAFREFIGGLKNGGEVSLEYLLDYGDDGQAELIEKLGDVDTFQLIGPATAWTWEFDALIRDIDAATPNEDRMTGTATVKITGKPELTVAGS